MTRQPSAPLGLRRSDDAFRGRHGMTARFDHDFAAFIADNPLVTPGAMRVRGTRIADLAKLGLDSNVIGARNDHLCVWPSVYRTAQLLSPRSQFILGNAPGSEAFPVLGDAPGSSVHERA